MIREIEYVSHPREVERRRAMEILAACTGKPIRRVTTQFLGHDKKLKCKPRDIAATTEREREREASRRLQTRIVTYLLENGPTTGKVLADELESHVGKIGNAVTHCMIGRKQVIDQISKSYSTLFYIIRGD